MYLYGVITHLQNTKACSKLRFSGAPGDKCIPSNASKCWDTGDKLSCTQCIFGFKETPAGFECKANVPQDCAALGGDQPTSTPTSTPPPPTSPPPSTSTSPPPSTSTSPPPSTSY